jgi:hypothetical protein
LGSSPHPLGIDVVVVLTVAAPEAELDAELDAPFDALEAALDAPFDAPLDELDAPFDAPFDELEAPLDEEVGGVFGPHSRPDTNLPF